MVMRMLSRRNNNNKNSNSNSNDNASVASHRSSSSVSTLRSSRVDRISSSSIPVLNLPNTTTLTSLGMDSDNYSVGSRGSHNNRQQQLDEEEAQFHHSSSSSAWPMTQSPQHHHHPSTAAAAGDPHHHHHNEHYFRQQEDPHDQGLAEPNNNMTDGILRMFGRASSSSIPPTSIPPIIQQQQSSDNLSIRSTTSHQSSQQQQQPTPTSFASDWHCCCRLTIVALLAATLTWMLWTGPHQWQQWSARFFEWVAAHPARGILAVVGLLALGTVCFLPAALLTIGAGFAFHKAFDHNFAKGLVLGSVAVFLGAVLGSILSFLLGRYLFRQHVLNLAVARYPAFRAIDQALQGNAGLKIMFLLRLSPLIPSNALDYISGVTSIPLWSYTLAMTGILPGTVLFVAIGATASTISKPENEDDINKNPSSIPATPITPFGVSNNKLLEISALAAGLVCAIGAVAMASYYSKIELNKILEHERRERQRKRQHNTAYERGRGFLPHADSYNLHELKHEDTSSLT